MKTIAVAPRDCLGLERYLDNAIVKKDNVKQSQLCSVMWAISWARRLAVRLSNILCMDPGFTGKCCPSAYLYVHVSLCVQDNDCVLRYF